MQQPKFTWWPWRILALTLPLFAAGNTFLAAEQQHTDKQLLQVFFGMIGAGNGFLVASAIGDFGRSILAIPVGALAALLCASFADVPAFGISLYVFLAVLVGYYAITRFFEHPLTSLALLAGAALFGLVILINPPRAHDSVTLVVPLAYPFVCAAICASMPLERNFSGMFAAAMAGVMAALWGIFYGIGAVIAFMMLLATTAPRNSVAMGASVLALSIANYVCIRVLFNASVRVGGERTSRRTVESAEEIPPPDAQASTLPPTDEAAKPAVPSANPADFSAPMQEKSAPL